MYKGINALYWPSIINHQLLPPHSVLYWPSTQLHHLVTHSWADWIYLFHIFLSFFSWFIFILLGLGVFVLCLVSWSLNLNWPISANFFSSLFIILCAVEEGRCKFYFFIVLCFPYLSILLGLGFSMLSFFNLLRLKVANIGPGLPQIAKSANKVHEICKYCAVQQT